MFYDISVTNYHNPCLQYDVTGKGDNGLDSGEESGRLFRTCLGTRKKMQDDCDIIDMLVIFHKNRKYISVTYIHSRLLIVGSIWAHLVNKFVL